ncbi:MAG: hypothetical protein ACWGKN_09250 [Desulfoprunum sp.]|jgi:hypothetical protein
MFRGAGVRFHGDDRRLAVQAAVGSDDRAIAVSVAQKIMELQGQEA